MGVDVNHRVRLFPRRPVESSRPRSDPRCADGYLPELPHLREVPSRLLPCHLHPTNARKYTERARVKQGEAGVLSSTPTFPLGMVLRLRSNFSCLIGRSGSRATSAFRAGNNQAGCGEPDQDFVGTFFPRFFIRLDATRPSGLFRCMGSRELIAGCMDAQLSAFHQGSGFCRRDVP